jgi:hypothetical protein
MDILYIYLYLPVITENRDLLHCKKIREIYPLS